MAMVKARSAAYGFIGTGEITTAIVSGLKTGRAGSPIIYLSPRSAGVAHDLADRFVDVRVCEQSVRIRYTAR